MSFCWKNVFLFAFSVGIVVFLSWIFSVFYKIGGPRPYSELEKCNVDVFMYTKTEDSLSIPLDPKQVTVSSQFQQPWNGQYEKIAPKQYTFIAKPEIREKSADADDYSSFLVAFVSVLATFVVLANFVNARELSKASEDAKKAKTTVERAKNSINGTKNEILEIKKNVEGTLESVNSTKTEVEDIKNKSDQMLFETTISMEQTGFIVKQFQQQFDMVNSSLVEQQTKCGELSDEVTKVEDLIESAQAQFCSLNSLYSKLQESFERQKSEIEKYKEDMNTRQSDLENDVEELRSISALARESVSPEEQNVNEQQLPSIPANGEENSAPQGHDEINNENVDNNGDEDAEEPADDK